jgi:hypothetical protein
MTTLKELYDTTFLKYLSEHPDTDAGADNYNNPAVLRAVQENNDVPSIYATELTTESNKLKLKRKLLKLIADPFWDKVKPLIWSYILYLRITEAPPLLVECFEHLHNSSTVDAVVAVVDAASTLRCMVSPTPTAFLETTLLA